MNFRTPVELPESSLQLLPQSRVLFIGSCFADHVGQRLASCLPSNQVCINPHGTLYNPVSIRNVLATYLADDVVKPFSEAGFFQLDSDEWRHWDYATKYTASSRAALATMLREEWQLTADFVRRADALFITFSTDHVYCLREGEYRDACVANCHKQPMRLFREEVADWNTLCAQWTAFLSAYHRDYPKQKVIFTLSPYRYAKYGMHENALSKSRLLLLIDSLCRDFGSFVSYFPAYEIITDELRDYRFYASDMLHPSEQAIDYVWEQFTVWAFTPQLTAYARERSAILRDMQHRPINPNSEAHQQFLLRLAEKKRKFEAKWGSID